MSGNILAFVLIGALSFIFIILGIFLCNGKLLGLIAGYNMLSPAEKEKINGKRLGKIVGIFLFVVAFLMILTVLTIIFFPGHELAIGIVLLVSILLGVTILFFIKDRK